MAIDVATYVDERLLANPTPPSTYQTWQIAQAHAVLNEGVSDFAIEFAADMYGGGGGGDNVAQVTPGTFAPDGQIDVDPLGNIAWYGWSELEDPALRPARGVRIFPPANMYHPAINAGVASLPNAQAASAFVWRHDRFDAGVYDISAGTWARTNSNTTGPLTPTGVENAFCDWPYLLRIRYRVHDPKGQIASGAPLFNDANNNGSQDAGEEIIDSRNGIWFEQIIPINRPIPQRVQ